MVESGRMIALDGGVGDVALVPQGDILEARLGVERVGHGRDPDLLALDRVALVGHRRRSLLAGAEGLLDLTYLRALEVADLGREALEAGARRERSRSAAPRAGRGRPPAWRHLSRSRPSLPSTRSSNSGLGRRVGSHRPGDRADGQLGEGALQARSAFRCASKAKPASLMPNVVGSACTHGSCRPRACCTCSLARSWSAPTRAKAPRGGSPRRPARS